MIDTKLELPMKLMAEKIDELKIDNPKIYADFLAQTFYYVSHSTRLLALGAGLMKQNEGQYFRRFIKHINEESNHEILAQKDLEEIGFSLDDFKERAETKSLYEPQYYKIMQQDPMVFMGYILALEQFACVHFPKFLERINKEYAGKAVRFVKLHAEEDPDHVEKAIKFIESLSEERVKLVIENIEQTAISYANLCNACNESESISTNRQVITPNKTSNNETLKH